MTARRGHSFEEGWCTGCRMLDGRRRRFHVEGSCMVGGVVRSDLVLADGRFVEGCGMVVGAHGSRCDRVSAMRSLG
jgi:hypothetical protein